MIWRSVSSLGGQRQEVRPDDFHRFAVWFFEGWLIFMKSAGWLRVNWAAPLTRPSFPWHKLAAGDVWVPHCFVILHVHPNPHLFILRFHQAPGKECLHSTTLSVHTEVALSEHQGGGDTFYVHLKLLYHV